MIFARSGLSLEDKLPGESVTLGEALMAPTVIYVKQDGNIEDAEMKRTFNMGIGMVLVAGEKAAQRKEVFISLL
ncbi:putative phosphoribosylformylglycinamidine cyclo-ligase [Helianthus annuus]|uniref:Phosphoribosylformylglycinamidine cyclo-ligase n=1 Tax=Helianthus annuus TaxID=4232 RepID=A0A9K3E2C1_HELAN|nr:putative phosphoribosylformylglycinamidine cyclo-ligase [Helianthus annuus]KAJ0451399.1 putative phosphoribosylformylglycinamidine cyclo-ligase [Helianthus annuus]KAJ0451402.1 putative phosphoribosylformylglycinamidine cyclo-ligase [Helianthus annuus]KAJ0455894.1 putative phosphoribosylformylglycinamidine cyclo-ligase [Helianthus annuus]KAJ0455899.1 putative phosphoribosylformylglycinamidine cyclo-ligase [Helianthus annuus]